MSFPTAPISGSAITGTVGVPNGGTGAATFTAHGVLIGEGTSAVTATAVGGTGTYLRGASGADPAWSTLVLPNATTKGDELYASATNTIASRARPRYDIRAYGAVGDGVTDDAPAIQLAINAAIDSASSFASRAGTVFFPPAPVSWRWATAVTATLTQSGAGTADCPYFVLEGCGDDGMIRLATGAGVDALTILLTNMEWAGIVVRNISLLGAGSATDCRGGWIIQVAPQPAVCIWENVRINNVYAANAPVEARGGHHIFKNFKNNGSTAGDSSPGYLLYANQVYDLDIDGIRGYSEYEFAGVNHGGGGATTAFVGVTPISDSEGMSRVRIRNIYSELSNPYVVHFPTTAGNPHCESLVIDGFQVSPQSGVVAGVLLDRLTLANGSVATAGAMPLANMSGAITADFKNIRAFGGGSLTFATDAASDVTLINTSLSAITNALGTVHTSTSGVDTWRNDSITTGQTAGVVLDNQTAATVGAQKFAPATARKTKGWGTTAGASESVEAWDQLQPVQATNAAAALVWYLKNGSQSSPGTARMSIGEIHPAFGTLLGRLVCKFLGATANYITLATAGMITDDAASYNGLDIGVTLSNTLAFATSGANRALIDSTSLRPATAAMTLGTNALPWKRLHIEGTAHVTGDWGTLTGWGTGATVSAVTGDDNHFTVTITAGTTPSANPTATLTFKDGTWTGAPWALCNLEATSDAIVVAPWTTCTTTATTLVITFHGTPVDTKTYTFRGIVLGG